MQKTMLQCDSRAFIYDMFSLFLKDKDVKCLDGFGVV